jgi:hypothetical protein
MASERKPDSIRPASTVARSEESASGKRAYESPAIVPLGTVDELTHGTGTKQPELGTSKDG